MGNSHDTGRHGKVSSWLAKPSHKPFGGKSFSAFTSRSGSAHTSASATPRLQHQPNHLNNQSKQLITNSWAAIKKLDQDYVFSVLAKWWLRAAERCPTWIWALIGLSEFDQHQALDSSCFHALVGQIYNFVDTIVVELELDMDKCREHAAKCGQRHVVYFPDGFQQAYWQAFTQSLHDAITELVTTDQDNQGSQMLMGAVSHQSICDAANQPELNNNKHNTPTRTESCRHGQRLIECTGGINILNKTSLVENMNEWAQRTKALHTIKRRHKITQAWHLMLNLVLADMKRGYTGELRYDHGSEINETSAPSALHCSRNNSPEATPESDASPPRSPCRRLIKQRLSTLASASASHERLNFH